MHPPARILICIPSAHRQRNLDYIEELETEIFRLRSSGQGAHSESAAERSHGSPLSLPTRNTTKTVTNVNINILIQSFNGQIAPGVFATSSSHIPATVDNTAARHGFQCALQFFTVAEQTLIKVLSNTAAKSILWGHSSKSRTA